MRRFCDDAQEWSEKDILFSADLLLVNLVVCVRVASEEELKRVVSEEEAAAQAPHSPLENFVQIWQNLVQKGRVRLRRADVGTMGRSPWRPWFWPEEVTTEMGSHTFHAAEPAYSFRLVSRSLDGSGVVFSGRP